MAEDDMLKCFGGLENNSLMSVINNNAGVIASDMFDIANQSSYTSVTKIDVALDVQPKDFTILSLNCQSLPAKIDNLTVLLETIATDFKVSAICLQETWLSNDSDTSLFELYGYKLISAGKLFSVHSGLMIYLSDEYNFKCLNLHEQSSIWDGLFIEVYRKPLNRKQLVIGNIYRPPRETIDNYHTFSSELAPILTFLNNSKCEVVIAGDFNIDLLKLNENNNVRFFSTPSLAMLFILQLLCPQDFLIDDVHLLTTLFVNLVLKLQTM